MSEKNMTALYNCIAEPITEYRIKYKEKLSAEMDGGLFRLQSEIWRAVHKQLGLKGRP